MKGFTRLHGVEEALAAFSGALPAGTLGAEETPLDLALGRTLAADVIADEDLPPFDRSAVDGFAVRAADLTGATTTERRSLRVVGEVRMGVAAGVSVGASEAVRMPTGGMMPAGADAIVMQEVCTWRGEIVEVSRTVTAGENLVRRGEDVRRGDLVLGRGTLVRPQEVAILSGLGVIRPLCARAPRVAIFSTGDEVVPPDRTPAPGQVRDMNALGLSAQVARVGGVARVCGILPDDVARVEDALRAALTDADIIVLSGGSSVGTLDVQDQVIPRLGSPGVLVHGVTIKPGKPTLLAVCDGKPVVGLPGHPVSSMIVFEVFVRPVLESMLGVAPRARGAPRVPAILERALRAPAERDEYVRLALRRNEDRLMADPILGKSSMMTTMTGADGYTRVRAGERLDAGAVVDVSLFA